MHLYIFYYIKSIFNRRKIKYNYNKLVNLLTIKKCQYKKHDNNNINNNNLHNLL